MKLLQGNISSAIEITHFSGTKKFIIALNNAIK